MQARRRSRLNTGGACLGFLAIVVAACGGSAGGPPGSEAGAGAGAGSAGAAPGGAASSVDACTLFTDEEITSATGEGVSSRAPSTLTQVFESVCDVKLDEAGELTVSILSTGGRQMWEDSFEPTIGSELLDEAVSGLGDAAARADDNELMVLQGDVLFDIVYLGFGTDSQLPAVRYLADVALAKLPCIASGCPGSSLPPPPPTTAGATDVCALLTGDEVGQATGLPVASIEPREALSCMWVLEGGSYVGAHYVELRDKPSGGREEFDIIANEAYDVDPEHVPGIGDDAVKLGGAGWGSMYSVLGDRLLKLEFAVPLDIDDPHGLLAPLLKSAVSRL